MHFVQLVCTLLVLSLTRCIVIAFPSNTLGSSSHPSRDIQRHLDEGLDSEVADVLAKYSIKYDTCYAQHPDFTEGVQVDAVSEEGLEDAGSESGTPENRRRRRRRRLEDAGSERLEAGFLLQPFVSFRLCLTDSCGNDWCDDTSEYGEIVIPMSSYLEAVVDHKREAQDKHCETCQECIEYGTADARLDDCCEGRCNTIDTSSCDDCQRIENMEENGYIDAAEFIECQRVANEDGESLYAGPMCTSDGRIKIGIFLDEDCVVPDDTKDVENYLGDGDGKSMKLSHALLKQTYATGGGQCIATCLKEEGYALGQHEITTFCEMLYYDSSLGQPAYYSDYLNSNGEEEFMPRESCTYQSPDGTYFAGKFCEYPATSICETGDDGMPSFCTNDGRCVRPSIYADNFCVCPAGFRGKYCELILDPGEDDALSLEGEESMDDDTGITCNVGPYRCFLNDVCYEIDGGKDCTPEACSSRPSQNVSSCENGARAACSQGTWPGSPNDGSRGNFGGFGECDGTPCYNQCLNGGTCRLADDDSLDDSLEDSCDCSTAVLDYRRFFGLTCEYGVTESCTTVEGEEMFCTNRGRCQRSIGDGCICPNGFGGPHCEYVVETTPLLDDVVSPFPPVLTDSYTVSDKNALMYFYRITRGYDWERNDLWLEPDSNVCDWYGVGCNRHEAVTSLELSENGLVGMIEQSVVSQLANLTVLNLRNNSLTGTLPEDIGSLQRLNHLDLSNNNIGGSIPASISGLPRLQSLQLQYNQFTWMSIGDNAFPFLQHLDLGNNSLEGTLQYAVARLERLEHVVLRNNRLVGGLENYNLLKKLTHFDVSSNMISGVLSGQTLLENPNLEYVNVVGNMISGIDAGLCESQWNGYNAAGCDGIACSPGTANAVGRQLSYDKPCEPCVLAPYFGTMGCNQDTQDDHHPASAEDNPTTLPLSQPSNQLSLAATASGDDVVYDSITSTQAPPSEPSSAPSTQTMPPTSASTVPQTEPMDWIGVADSNPGNVLLVLSPLMLSLIAVLF